MTEVPGLPILLTVCTVPFEAFMFMPWYYLTITLSAVPLLQTYRHICLVLVEVSLTLNVLLHDPQGIRTFILRHGGMDMQSVHASEHL